MTALRFPARRRLLLLQTLITCTLLHTFTACWPAAAAGVGGCFFQGDCDLAWQANKAFDDGLRSKSENIVGPFRETYFQIAHDLFDERLKPLIHDIDSRFAARMGDLQNLINSTLDQTKHIVEIANGDVTTILATTAKLIESTVAQVDQEIDKVDCISATLVQSGDDIAKDLWGTFIIKAAIGLTDSCNWQEHYIWTVSGDEMPAYRAAKCIIHRDLINSKTVNDIVYNYDRLAGIAHYYVCKFRGTPGEGDTKRDFDEFTNAHDVWALALGTGSASK